MRPLHLQLFLLVPALLVQAFVPLPRVQQQQQQLQPQPQRYHLPQQPQTHKIVSSKTTTTTTTTTSTQRFLLLNVPDDFFAVTFFMSGIFLQISKKFARIRLEENAWEQRLADARKQQLRNDPTMTELDLRKQEAALEWSAYGEPRKQREAERKYRVQTMERNGNDETSQSRRDRPASGWSDAEIRNFEEQYGIDYDPYYDEPYTEDELPDDTPYETDRRYGDRTYTETGESFFRDQDTGLYYRQGAQPRNLNFWQ